MIKEFREFIMRGNVMDLAVAVIIGGAFTGIINSLGYDFILPLIIMRDHARLPVMVQLIRMVGEYIKLWGPLMAGYAMAALPIIVLFMFSMKLFDKGLTDGAVKG